MVKIVVLIMSYISIKGIVWFLMVIGIKIIDFIVWVMGLKKEFILLLIVCWVCVLVFCVNVISGKISVVNKVSIVFFICDFFDLRNVVNVFV